MKTIRDYPVFPEIDNHKPPKVGDLRVWWVSNPPHAGERYPVKNMKEAIATLDKLAQRDLALGDVVVCNAGGLEYFDSDGEWYEFRDDDDRDIDEIINNNG